MRVLLVNSILWGGGVDSQTLGLARALIAQGLQVVLAAPAKARMTPEAQRIEGLVVEGIEASRAGWPLALRRLIRRHRVDIVHAHHGRDYWISVLGRMFAGGSARVFVTRHLMTPFSTGTQKYLGRFATLIAVSDAVAQALRDRPFGDRLRIHRIYCGIDTGLFKASAEARRQVRTELALADKAFVFGLVGNVHSPEGKGHFVFAEAALRVAAECPQACFVCIGEGELKPQLQARVAELGIAQQFRFVGFCDDLQRRLPALDALVHPAVGSEALGLVILEALSCEKPVIVSRLDGIPETLIDGEQGWVVPPRDAGALATRMIALARDPALARRMGERGRPWVEQRFSLDSLGRETAALYHSAVPAIARLPKT